MPFDPNQPFQPYQEAPPNPNQVAQGIEQKQAEIGPQSTLQGLSPALISKLTPGIVDTSNKVDEQLSPEHVGRVAVAGMPLGEAGSMAKHGLGSLLGVGAKAARAATSPIKTAESLAEFLKR